MVVTVVAVVGEEPVKEKGENHQWKTYVNSKGLFYSSKLPTSQIRMTSHDGKVGTPVFTRFRTTDNTTTEAYSFFRTYIPKCLDRDIVKEEEFVFIE